MSRHNHIRGKKRQSMADRWDSAYIDLPEFPEIGRIHAVPLKTVYRNIAAAPWAREVYEIRSWNDPMMQIIARKIQGGNYGS